MNWVKSQTSRQVTLDILLLCVLLGLFFAFMLGNRPLSVPDEGRYVEIPREMVTTGDYLTPRLDGVKYFEKPVLFYWLEAFSIKLFGLDEFTLRLWPALFALAGCLAVYLAGRRLYGRRSGLLAAVVLATSVLYYALSRAIILDMPVSVLLTIALLSFLLGTHEPPGWKRRLFFWNFYVFAALAVLTKGLIGILIPAIIIGCWIMLLGEWRMLKTLYLPSGIFLFLLIAAPWHILVGKANPEFFHFYFIHEHFQRYLTKVHDRYKPAWFFVPVLLLGLFPWSAFIVQAVKFNMPLSWRERREHRDALFLVLWAGLVFLFFSASDSKLIPYVLPIFPPLALLIGRYFSAAWDSKELPGILPGFVVLAALSIIMAVGLAVAPHFRTDLSDRALHPYFYAAAVALVAGTAGSLVFLKKDNFRRSFAAITAGAVLFMVILNAASPLLDNRSVKGLSEVIEQRLRPGDDVACFGAYYQDLPVYLERRITVVNWTGELKFGSTLENTSSWILNQASFWKRWNGPATIYMLTKRGMYDALKLLGRKHLYLIASSHDDVLVVNKEIAP